MPIVIAALIITLLGGVGTVAAARDAHPGDPLYRVKEVVAQASESASATVSPRANARQGKGDGAADETTDSPAGTHGPDTSVISDTVAITLTKTFSDVVNVAGDMPGQSENGLDAKLRAVENSLSRGNTVAAGNQIAAFLHQANAACRSGHLDEAKYDTLYADYSELVAGLGGQAQPSAAPCATASTEDPDDEDDDSSTDDDDTGPNGQANVKGADRSQGDVGKGKSQGVDDGNQSSTDDQDTGQNRQAKDKGKGAAVGQGKGDKSETQGSSGRSGSAPAVVRAKIGKSKRPKAAAALEERQPEPTYSKTSPLSTTCSTSGRSYRIATTRHPRSSS